MGSVPEKIALDTSALLQKKGLLEKIRLWGGNHLEVVIPNQVKLELKTLKNRDKKWFKKIVMIEAEQQEFGVKEKKTMAGNADDALVELAEKGFAVLSLDKKLQKRIQEKKGKLVEIRGNRFYVIMED
jgi:rRNA-processing protein FCF1